MSDKLKYFIEAWELNGVGETVATVQDSPGTVVTITVDDLRALLARQPAAIDRQEAVYQVCNGALVWVAVDKDFYDQAHESQRRKVYAAPLANEASKPAAPKNPKDAPKVWRGGSNAALAWACGWNECLEARAASTSANVTQGAEAVKSSYVDWDLVERMRCGEEIDSEEAGMLGAMMDGQDKEISALRAALAAPPAQTALTDAEVAAFAIQACACRTAADGWIFENTDQLREFLTAAQSASGADHAN